MYLFVPVESSRVSISDRALNLGLAEAHLVTILNGPYSVVDTVLLTDTYTDHKILKSLYSERWKRSTDYERII